MTIANLGSISQRVWNIVDNIPSNVSGAEMLSMVYDQVLYMEQYTGQSMGSVNIAEKYQPALVALSCAAVQRAVEIQGADRGFTIGELTVNSASTSNNSSDFFKEDGMEKLKRLGRQFGVYKAYG